MKDKDKDEDYSPYMHGITDPKMIEFENKWINELLRACDRHS